MHWLARRGPGRGARKSREMAPSPCRGAALLAAVTLLSPPPAGAVRRLLGKAPRCKDRIPGCRKCAEGAEGACLECKRCYVLFLGKCGGRPRGAPPRHEG